MSNITEYHFVQKARIPLPVDGHVYMLERLPTLKAILLGANPLEVASW